MSLEIFEEQIRSIEELQHLFLNDPKREYICSPNTISIKFTHLHKCVMKTGKYPFLNQYIDIYLSLNPQVIDEQNEEGWTALMLSARNSRTDSSEETVKLLLEYGANVDIQEKDGWTALIMAARYSRTDSSEKTVKIILEYGANVDIQDEYGRTALIMAACFSRKGSSEKTVKLLLKHGANVDIQEKDGCTALMMAVRFSRTNSTEETVKMLLKHGANIHLTNGDNHNILYLSLISGSLICIGMIIASYIMKNTVVNISENKRKYIINLLQSMKTDRKNKVIEAFQNHLEIEYAGEEIIRNRYNFIKVKDNVNVIPLNYPRITKSKLYDFKFIRNFQIKTIRDLFLNF